MAKIRFIAASTFIAITTSSLSPSRAQITNDDWDFIGIQSAGSWGTPSIYKVQQFNSSTGKSEILSTNTNLFSAEGLTGTSQYSSVDNRIHFGTLNGSYYYDLTNNAWGKSNLSIFSGITTINSNQYVPRQLAVGGGGEEQECTEVGNGIGAILVCPPGLNKPKSTDLGNSTLNSKTTAGEIQSSDVLIDGVSLKETLDSLTPTIDDDGILAAKTAITDNKTNIGVNSTNIETNRVNIGTNTKNIETNRVNIGTNTKNIETNRVNIGTNTKNIETNRVNIGTNAKNIETNRSNIITNNKTIQFNSQNIESNRVNVGINSQNIESNRKNINNLGSGIASATALTAALSSLPVTTEDAPFSCGVGTGGYSSRFAMGIGCAARLSERISFNAGGSHVFGASSNYGGGSLDTFTARAGFVFKLGTIQKPASGDEDQLQSQLNEMKEENASIKSQNQELIARLERLEAIALGNQTSTTSVSLK